MDRDQLGRGGRVGDAVIRKAIGHRREELSEGLTRAGDRV
jgi:hypothetical protein